MRVCRRLLYVAVLLAALPGSADAGESLDLRDWKDGLPVGWVASEGARRGFVGPTTATNRFEPLDGGGVASVGRPGLQRWMMLSRRFAAKPGETFRIDFEARAVDLKPAGMEFANRWIGAFFKDAKGNRLAFPLTEVHATTWQKGFLHVRAPQRTAYGEAAFFCSLAGRFEVRRMAVERLDAKDSFDILVRDMDRYYPFFARHGIDWKALAAKHRAEALAAKTPAAFATAITPMLADLEDGHIWIDVPGARRKQPHVQRIANNFGIQQILARLKTTTQVMRNILGGRTKDGYAYLAIGTMQGTLVQLDHLDAHWRKLFDAPAIVLDLRVNGGGDEAWGQRLLGCLTDKPVAYGTSRLRAGPAHDAFHPGGTRYLRPRKERYRGPVVVLIGPGCVSSGEGMAMMAKALPDVTLVGLPTRGSSGSPSPVHLPNGVSVWYSRWISLLPDGTGFERKGIAPDVRVEHEKGKDPAFDKALELIRKALAK